MIFFRLFFSVNIVGAKIAKTEFLHLQNIVLQAPVWDLSSSFKTTEYKVIHFFLINH